MKAESFNIEKLKLKKESRAETSRERAADSSRYQQIAAHSSN